jgi:phage major head subunit gpT-like protein
MLITPSFLFQLEYYLQVIQNDTYANLMQHMWWQDIAVQRQSKSLKELFFFSLESAQLHEGGEQGGYKDFDVMRWLQNSVTNTYKQSAFELTEQELEDLDSHGVAASAQWLREITTVSVYQPQKSLAELILANPLAYDGVTFFNSAHPTNGMDTTQGTYSNVGVKPIDTSVTLDVAAANLASAIAQLRTTKTPTGYPRNMVPRAILVPPALAFRAQQLTNARFISTTTGSTDNLPLITNVGLGQPVVAPELGAAFSGGSDTTWYVVMESVGEVAGAIYVERTPYSTLYHTKMTDVELDIADKLVWVTKGRNSTALMHPFCIARFTST